KVWDAAGGKEPITLDEHKGGATFLAFNPAGTLLATAGVDGKVRVWDWPSRDPRQTLEGHQTPEGQPELIQCLAFSADGTLLASGSQSCVIIWDVDTLRPHHTPK